MNPILENISTADKKLVQFKKLAKKVFNEANADGVIDAEEKKEVTMVAGQIKAVQDVIQRLKDEFARNMAEWNGHSGDHADLQEQITKLREWGHPDVAPIEAAAGKINDAVLEQYWKEATAQLLACQKDMKPVFDDYLFEYAAREKFLPDWDDFCTRYETVSDTLFMTPTLASALPALGAYKVTIEGHVAELKYIAAMNILASAFKTLMEIEQEITDLTRQKAEVESFYATLRTRINATQVSVFDSVADMSADIGKSVELIDKSIADCDYVSALDRLTSLVMSLSTYETELAKIASAKEIYEPRLASLQSDLADAVTGEFDELLPQQASIEQIRDRMEGLAANEDFENALIELDLLAIELEDFMQQLIIMRVKADYEALLAELEPQIVATGMSTFYPPVNELSADIDKDYNKAKSAAIALEFARGITLLEGLRPKLDAYETLLAEFEAAKTQYEADLGEVIQRFDAMASNEYPSMLDTQQRAIDTRSEMEGAAEKGEYPAALDLLGTLRLLMDDLEAELQVRDEQRADYDSRVGGVLARVDAQNISDFIELEQPRIDMMKKRDSMEESARGNEFGMALDYMAQVEFALDTIEARMAELNKIKDEFEAALAGIQTELKQVEGCTHVELAVKKTEIIKLRDVMQTAVSETKYDVAMGHLTDLEPLLEAFQELEEQLKEYTRRLEKAKPRVEAVKAVEYKSFKDQKEEITDLYDRMVAQANKAELGDALDNMDDLEDLLKDFDEDLKEMQTDEIRYKDRLSVMQPDIDAIEENETESASKAKKAALAAYKEMTDDADDDEFTKALGKAGNVSSLIDAFKAVLAVLKIKSEKYEALKGAIFKRLDKAKENADDIKTLGDKYTALAKLKDEAVAKAEAKEHEEALGILDNLDKGLTEFETSWLALHDAKNSYNSDSSDAIKKYESYSKEEQDRAENEYNTATGYYEKMVEAAEREDYGAALDRLSELKVALTAVDDALLSENEVKQKCIGMYEILDSSISDAESSVHIKELGDEIIVVQKAAEIGHNYKDRENYQGAIDEAPKIEKALDAFNTAEDALEQTDAAQKAQYEERKSGFEKRYLQALKPDNEPEDADLAKRIAALPVQWKAMIAAEGKSPVDYKELLKLAGDLRDEVDSILAALEAEEDAAQKGGGGADGGKGEEEDDDKWDWLENQGKEIVKVLADKLLDEVKDQVGGRIDAIYDTGMHLKDAYDSYQDEDYWGVLSDSAKALKDAAKLNPALNNPATKKIIKAVEWADDALGVYEKGAAVYDWITD